MLPEDRFVAGEECWAACGGYRMRYLLVRAGRQQGNPPLVLAHGLLGYSFSWRHNLSALAEDRDVYAIDLLGIGFSERPPRDAVSFDLRESAERVLLWMVGLGLKGADVIGTSHGGGVATMMAALDRERDSGAIGRLVLVASINPWSRTGLRRTRVLGHPAGAWLFRRMALLSGMFSAIRGVALGRMYGDPRKITEETRQGYDAHIPLERTADYVLGVVRYWRRDLRELERAIATIGGMPVLLIWGDRDGAVPLYSAYELKKHLPGAELVVFPGIGHLPYEEAPEEFNNAVRAFLSRATRPLHSAPH